jgi:hypothetical protein
MSDDYKELRFLNNVSRDSDDVDEITKVLMTAPSDIYFFFSFLFLSVFFSSHFGTR